MLSIWAAASVLADLLGCALMERGMTTSPASATAAASNKRPRSRLTDSDIASSNFRRSIHLVQQ
jgi:hypothetical protein